MKCETRDFSPTGVGIYVEKPIDIGEEIGLTIQPPSFTKPFTVPVTVRRCGQNTDDNSDVFPYVAGFSFNEVPAHVKEWIDGLPCQRY